MKQNVRCDSSHKMYWFLLVYNGLIKGLLYSSMMTLLMFKNNKIEQNATYLNIDKERLRLRFPHIFFETGR